MAGQDVEQGDDGTWQIAQKVAPERVISTVDPEARHMHKSRSEYRDGYKAHLAIEPETGLVTAAALTPATAPDGRTGIELLVNEESGLQGTRDGAYGTGEMLAALVTAKHRQAIKPLPMTSAVPGGFTRDDFIVDDHAGRVTCPAGHIVSITPKRSAALGTVARHVPSGPAARKPKMVGHFTSMLTTTNSSSPDGRGAKGDFAEAYRRFRPMVGEIHRVASGRQPPTSPIPRRREEPTRPLPTDRSNQPQASDQPRTDSKTEGGQLSLT